MQNLSELDVEKVYVFRMLIEQVGGKGSTCFRCNFRRPNCSLHLMTIVRFSAEPREEGRLLPNYREFRKLLPRILHFNGFYPSQR